MKSIAELRREGKKKKKKAEQDVVMAVVEDHFEKFHSTAPLRPGPTALIQDPAMMDHLNLWDGSHPERPERFAAVMGRITTMNLLPRLHSLLPRPATIQELELFHPRRQVERLAMICSREKSDEQLENLASNYDSIYFHPSSYECALNSAGCSIQLVDSILEEEVRNGMAVVRPPGHHAGPSEFNGFCFFNNVVLAAKRALATGHERILIVDFDVHHGQATQRAFYEDPRVLYFSTHRYEHGRFWPNLRESNWDFVGDGAGTGFNFNVPLNSVGMGNAEFLAVWFGVLMPAAYQFNPSLVLVSAGYDAALGCPEGRMRLTPACYPHLIRPLMGLAEGRVALFLEGGYCLKSLAEGAALSLRCLLGDPCPAVGPVGRPSVGLLSTIRNVAAVHPDQLVLSTLQPPINLPIPHFDWTEPPPTQFPTRDHHQTYTEEECCKLEEELNRLEIGTDLSVAPVRVGLVYDEGMLGHWNEAGPHPESPARLTAIHSLLTELHLLPRCKLLSSRVATEEELLLVHNEEHLQQMYTIPTLRKKELRRLEESYNSVYLNSESNHSALLAAGGLLELVDAVMGKEVQCGMALIRPPGHHAEEGEACGFCIYNNVAVAGRYAREVHGVGRLLLLDWDVHHGNGIQHIFYNDPSVLYISIHRYEHGSFFPGSPDAALDKCGAGPGLGYNVNIPFSGGRMGDAEYLSAFLNIVMPIAYEFGPELVIVSAGFDAARGDPLGGYSLTPELYAHMTHLLSTLANGRLILALEGGYNLNSISYSAAACLKAMLGDPLPALEVGGVKPRAMELLREVAMVQGEWWGGVVVDAAAEGVEEEKKVKAEGGVAAEEDEEKLEARMERMGLTKVEGEREADSPPPLLEGAVGGVSVNTVQEAFHLMFGEGPSPHDTLYLITPLPNCPHVCPPPYTVPPPTTTPCSTCSTSIENWACLECGSVGCSRYAAGHAEAHYNQSGHPLALSYSDLSVWCYACGAYIDAVELRGLKRVVHLDKFGE